MGLLDDVIGAALGSRPESGQPAQGQSSPIAAALIALLASRAGAGSVGQQGSLGGLDGLVNQFKQSGFEDIINSWIGTGQNQPVSANQLRQALGPETVDDLSDQTGVPHDDLLSQLSKILPGVVDRLTPNGQLPNETDLLPGPRSR
jgi:uncharacterized protein YidB (DUF937 family)